jgi:hypothetical protein
MPTLILGTRSYVVSVPRVTRQAVRMFKMSPERRKQRVEGAKVQLVRSARGSQSAGALAAAKEAAAILLPTLRMAKEIGSRDNQDITSA